MSRVVVLQCLWCLVLILTLSAFFFPYTLDSMVYITTAEHMSEHKGLVFTNFYADIAAHELPSFLEPPGYPLLISLVKIFGFDGYTAAILIPRLCYVLMPLLLFLMVQNLLPEIASLVVSLVAVSMFSIIKCSLMAWADVPYLCFSLLTLLSVIELIKRKLVVPWYAVLGAGILAGFTALIKYVGLSLILAIGFTGLLACLLKIIPRNKGLKAFFLYTIGVCLVMVPYFIRNWVVFGTLQPFRMPPGNIGLEGIVLDLFNNLSKVLWADPSYGWIMMITMTTVLIYVCAGLRRDLATGQGRCWTAVLLLSYLIFNTAFLMMCRSQNLITEYNDRYMIQLAWLWIVFGGYILYYGLIKTNYLRLVTALLLALFLYLQIVMTADGFCEQKRIEEIVNKIEHHRSILYKISPGAIVVSNIADVSSYLFHKQVRLLGAHSPSELKSIFYAQPIAVLLFKEGKYISPFWSFDPQWETTGEFRRISSGENVDLLVYP